MSQQFSIVAEAAVDCQGDALTLSRPQIAVRLRLPHRTVARQTQALYNLPDSVHDTALCTTYRLYLTGRQEYSTVSLLNPCF
jgi:hypothetical protein